MSTWVPLTPEEKQAIQDTFSATSPGVLVQEAGDGIKGFALKSRSYYDLQDYIFTGLELERDIATFNSNFPESRLGRLTELESNIYVKIRDAIVNIGTNCYDFNKNGMGRFLLVTGKITTYCDTFARYVGGKNLLRDIIKALSGSPDVPRPTEAQIPGLQKRAEYLCGILSDAALKVQREIDELVLILKAFEGLTQKDKIAIDYLAAQFLLPKPEEESGPFEPGTDGLYRFAMGPDGKRIRRQKDGKPMQPYSVLIGQELAALGLEVTTAAAEARKQDANWKHDTIVASTAVTYIWIGIGGAIAGGTVMGVYTKRAIEAKEKYNAALAQATAANEKMATLASCVGLVTRLDSYFSNVQERIGKALAALENMAAHFTQQSTSFAAMKNCIETTQDTALLDESVRDFAELSMDAAIEAWADAKVLATDYIKYSSLSYVMK